MQGGIMNGYVKSYRKVEDNPVICKDNDYFRVWYYLLHNATHKEYPVIFNKEKIILKKGELITGRDSIAKKCNISSSKAQRILKIFEIEHQIKQQTSTKGRLITIVNWRMYQNDEQQLEQQVNNEWTTNEQQMNTNKNIKNVKNIKNNNISTTTTKPPSLFEVIEENFGRTLNSIEIEELSNWEDNELTRYVIKKAILSNVYSIRYISKILQIYKQKGIKTVVDAEKEYKQFEEKRNFRSNNNQKYKTSSEKTKKILDNWERKMEEKEKNDIKGNP